MCEAKEIEGAQACLQDRMILRRLYFPSTWWGDMNGAWRCLGYDFQCYDSFIKMFSRCVCVCIKLITPCRGAFPLGPFNWEIVLQTHLVRSHGMNKLSEGRELTDTALTQSGYQET